MSSDERRLTLANREVETFSTGALPTERRVEYWNDVVCSTFTSLTVDAGYHPLDARMRRVDVGDIRLAVAESSAATVTHSRAQASRASSSYFLLHLQLAGASTNHQTGREAELGPGDLTLFDSTRPYRITFRRPTSILVLRIPGQLMREYLACPEVMTLLPLVRSSPTSRLAARFIRDLWRRSADICAEGSGRHIADALMSVIAAAYAAAPRERWVGSARRAMVRLRLTECIEAHLRDPELSPAAIARMGHVSLRYLHLLFRDQGESVWRYVQRRRLDVCARALRDPLRGASSITEIACEHGFKSTAHFSRLFHERYGVAPSDYRSTAASAASMR